MLVVLGISSLLPATAYGDITACIALFSGPTVAPGTENSLNLQLYNDSATPIAWIQITRPNGNFTVVGASSQDWTGNYTDDTATYTDSTIDPAISYNRLYLQVQTSPDETPPATWTVQASDDPGGANPFTCSNAGLDLAISDGTGPELSGVLVSGVSAHSATISWSSDQLATSQVSYGLTDSYGSTSTLNSALTSEHSVTLTGLTANTLYHYQVLSDDAAANNSTSPDDTFLTTSSTSSAPPSDNTQPIITKVPIQAIPTEHVPPTISLSTNFTIPFKSAPTIRGTAADNDSLAAIEYSMDGGKNWLPVDAATGLGGKNASFSFTPLGINDGNYSLITRAIDTSGNTTNTSVVSLVIDQLDPLIGGVLVSQGPQVLTPGKDGVTSIVTGVSQKLTLSAVGGPTSVILSAQSTDSQPEHTKPAESAAFRLTKSADTGLWSGDVTLNTTGHFDLVANAVDGAGNKTTTIVSKLLVLSPARLVNQNNQKPLAGTVTLYYFEPNSRTWQVWDGASYNQTNPQKADKDGNFRLYIPAGKYYLMAQAPGFYTSVSNIFETDHSFPLASTLALKPALGLNIGRIHISWPMTTLSRIDTGSPVPITSQATSRDAGEATSGNQLRGKPAPDFSLMSTDGSTMRTADLLGRPTVLTFAATWLPTASEQLNELSQLQSNKDFNIVPIAMQEDIPKVQAFSAISGLKLRWFVDPGSSLSAHYGAPNMPTHYFLDRKGTIQHVKTGVLTKQQILDVLSSY